MTQGPEPTGPEAEPMVMEAVQAVRDRFGATGLRNLVSLATQELARVEQAEARLAAIENAGNASGPAGDIPDAADTQAWLAYTEVDPDQA